MYRSHQLYNTIKPNVINKFGGDNYSQEKHNHKTMFLECHGVTVYPCPRGLRKEYEHVFTKDSLKFLGDIAKAFDKSIEELYTVRLETKSKISRGWLPKFLSSNERKDKNWRISALPERLLNRHVDLGDVSPSHTAHFVDSLNAKVQGVQVDFDDGHCPTWRNTIQGIYNVSMATCGTLNGGPCNIAEAPILMLRPRAWNIMENHCIVHGKVIPGPIFDYAMLMYHCGKKLYDKKCGPFFYLSKIEGPNETKLWNDLFIWAQKSVDIPQGTIKACVLIENICAAFAMDEILYSLRDHSLGLNCGIWDYSASIISKFGFKEDFIIPDRNKYVNMEKPFLKNYMKLLIKTCHSRGAPATAGMAALLLNGKNSSEIASKVVEVKRKEIQLGFDGFLIYDLKLIPHINELWECELSKRKDNPPNEGEIEIRADDLLLVPKGGVTLEGLKQNIRVSLLFIYHWFEGSGHFFLNGAVEDSATAEICRSQLWQWVRHSVQFDDKAAPQPHVDFPLLVKLLNPITDNYYSTLCKGPHDKKRMTASKFLLLELVLSHDFPEFITTFLNDNHKFRALHNKSSGLLLSKL